MRQMDTLFQVHDSKSLLQDASLPGNAIFAQYFSRFDNITESSYTVSSSSENLAPQRWAKAVDRHGESEEVDHAERPPSSPQQESLGKEHSASWAARYRKGIQLTLASMESPIAPASIADIMPLDTPRRDLLSFESTTAVHESANNQYQMQRNEERLSSDRYNVEGHDAVHQTLPDRQTNPSDTATSCLTGSTTSGFGPEIHSFDYEFMMQFEPPDSFMLNC